MRLYLATAEGRDLFHIAIRVDKALRKLTVFTMRQIFPQNRYQFLSGNLFDAICEYRQFLEQIYHKVSSHPPNHDENTVHLPVFKDLMKGIRISGVPHKATISTKLGGDIFKFAKSTDLCVRICELYSQDHLSLSVMIREQICNEIQKIEAHEKDLTAEYLKIENVLKTRRKNQKVVS